MNYMVSLLCGDSSESPFFIVCDKENAVLFDCRFRSSEDGVAFRKISSVFNDEMIFYPGDTGSDRITNAMVIPDPKLS